MPGHLKPGCETHRDIVVIYDPLAEEEERGLTSVLKLSWDSKQHASTRVRWAPSEALVAAPSWVQWAGITWITRNYQSVLSLCRNSQDEILNAVEGRGDDLEAEYDYMWNSSIYLFVCLLSLRLLVPLFLAISFLKRVAVDKATNLNSKAIVHEYF